MNGRTFKERELFKKKKKKPKPFCSCSIWNFQGLFEQGNFITQFSSLNFHHLSLTTHHSSLITHHSIFHTHLASSLYFYHSIFFTLFMGPTPVTLSEHFCFVTRGTFSSHQNFVFSHFPFPFPFSPVTLPKQKPKPKPIKISQAPSPRQDHRQ